MTTSTQTQLRRGTTTQVNSMTPAAGEVVIDTSLNQPCVGDGSTAGGIKVPTAKMVQNQNYTYPTAGGTGNAITLTTQTGYTPVAAYGNGLKLSFKASATNTGAATVNADILGTKNIKKMSNGSLADLDAGDITSGGIYDITYDGTQFQLGGGASGSSVVNTYQNTAGVSSTGGMLGLAGSITPSKSGKVLFIISGDINQSGSGSVTLKMNYGTGSAPSAGAGDTGTTCAPTITGGTASGARQLPFTRQAIVTGLSLGTAYWFDLYASIGGSSTSFDGLSISAVEL